MYMKAQIRQIQPLIDKILEYAALLRNLVEIKSNRTSMPAIVEPIWPLPRQLESPSDQEILAMFRKFDSWFYSYKFEGAPGTSDDVLQAWHSDSPRPLQRFRHFMPWLIHAAGIP